MRRRLISAAVVLCIVFTAVSFSVCTAEGEVYFEPFSTEHLALELFERLGAIDSAPDFNLEGNITRSDFARFIAVFSGASKISQWGETSFSDVSKADANYAYISAAAKAGYFSGDGGGIFRPGDFITLAEAVSTLVKMTGYGPYAESLGGYPGGYLRAASENSILKNTSSSSGEAPTAAVIVRVCYNALNIDMLKTSGIGATQRYEAIKGETVLSQYHEIYKGNGIMTANAYTDLYTEDAAAGRNKIAVDKTVYLDFNRTHNDYLGRRVEFFYIDDKDANDREIAALIPLEGQNSILEIAHDKIISADNAGITYDDGGNASRRAELARGYNYIYNNGLLGDRTEADLNIKDGSLTLVDSNMDGVYDTVLATCPETMIVTGIDALEEIIYCRGGSVEMNSFEKDGFHSILKVKDGGYSSIDIDELTLDTVLTVYRSKNGRYVQVYASTNRITGVIKETDGEKAFLNGAWHEWISGFDTSKIALNHEITACIDMLGRIACVIESTDMYGFKYGYVYGAAWTQGVGKTLQMKILTGEGLGVISCEEKILVDGYMTNVSDILNGSLPNIYSGGKGVRQLIRYKLSPAGEITAIDTKDTGNSNEENDILEEAVSKQSKRYYTGIPSFQGESRIGEKTVVLTVPGAEAFADELKYYSVGHNFEREGYYTVSLYNIDEDSNIGAVVVHSDAARAPSTTEYTTVGVVEKITTSVNKEGNAANMIYLMSGGTPVSYVMDVENFPYPTDKFSFGDVVRFVLNSDGEVATCEHELNYQTKSVRGTQGYFTYRFGAVLKKGTTYFSVFDGLNTAVRYLIPANVSTYYIVDVANKEIKMGSYENIIAYADNPDDFSYIFTRTHSHSTLYHAFVYINV